MTKEQVFESGFVKAFIEEYFEYKIHSFYPDKDRLLYVLCNTNREKHQVTEKQIELIKSEIQKLGNEELSFAYLFSSKPKRISGHEYIETDKRFDFWLNNFCNNFIESIWTFTPIIEACNSLKNKISNEDFEDEFWKIYPASQKPNESCLPFIIQREAELINEIEYSISEFKQNEYWEFDFEEYERFVDISKPVEILFKHCELLVQLNRLEMFNEFLEIEDESKESKSEIIDWIEIFDKIDIENPANLKSYITNTIEQKQNYFSEASFNLTLQYLTKFKSETFFFDDKRKLDYLNSLNFEKPTVCNSESSLLNQTVFESQNNYFEFLNLYRSMLEKIFTKLDAFIFFQIEVIADLEFEGKIYKDLKQRNNDSILTTENWDQHKETFFTQRMKTYKNSYTHTEKIKLELSSLEKLSINETDYQILKDRYKGYLEQKQILPPQQTEKPKPEQKETELSVKINKHFGFFNRSCPRKHKQILNDTDFEKLIDWVIWYYKNEFKVPEILEPIRVVNTNKTFVQLAFKYLFKELHKSSPYPETLFEFYQSAFTPYSEDKKSNFEAVKNNDEVKKLMQIDY